MMTRPVAFPIWAAIWVVVMVYQVWAAYMMSRKLVTDWSEVTWLNWVPLATLIAVQALLTYSFWKMSRVPVIIFLIGVIFTVVGGFFVEVSQDSRFWLLGVIAPLVFAGAFIFTILPHWKKMTWSPLGHHDFGSPKGAL
jgi:hypothetical protein